MKATAETLSGIPLMQPTLTKYDAYVESMVDTLNGMLGDDDGDIAKAVIQETIAKIDELRNTDPLPTNFYQMVQDLVAAVEAKLKAMTKDTKVGVQNGTTGMFYCEGDEEWGFAGFPVTTVGYSNGALACQNILNGNVKYVIIDIAPAKAIVENTEKSQGGEYSALFGEASDNDKK